MLRLSYAKYTKHAKVPRYQGTKNAKTSANLPYFNIKSLPSKYTILTRPKSDSRYKTKYKTEDDLDNFRR